MFDSFDADKHDLNTNGKISSNFLILSFQNGLS